LQLKATNATKEVTEMTKYTQSRRKAWQHVSLDGQSYTLGPTYSFTDPGSIGDVNAIGVLNAVYTDRAFPFQCVVGGDFNNPLSDTYRYCIPIEKEEVVEHEPYLTELSFLDSGKAITIDHYSSMHHMWLRDMGWFGKTTLLEDLMLVVSECGEAANEVRGEAPTNNFKLELADIVLRVMGIAAKQGISLDNAIRGKMRHNLTNGKKPDRIK
jgi:NTP pyrophosphatase (non-canonical NTP hydrolase)